MSEELPNQAAVLAAVDRLLTAGASGDDVADALGNLVAETSKIPLINLEPWERLLRERLWTFERKPTSTWWIFRSRRAGFASWLDLCSGDGFRRERIMRSLSGGTMNAFFLALAIRRLNDWVPQVRAAAREHIARVAENTDPAQVVDALWNVLAHCGSWGRMEETDWKVLAELIAHDRIATSLVSRIKAATAGPATKIMSQAGRTPVLDDRLEEIASAAVQPSVRAKAYRSLFEGRMVWVVGQKWRWIDLKWCKGRFEPVIAERAITERIDFPARLKMAVIDRSALVRRIGAEFLIKELVSIGADAVTLAEQLAADPSAYVAERGRFALARLSSLAGP